MKRKNHIVMWHFNGKVTINGRYHKSPKPQSTSRLMDVLDAITYYKLTTNTTEIYHINRGN